MMQRSFDERSMMKLGGTKNSVSADSDKLSSDSLVNQVQSPVASTSERGDETRRRSASFRIKRGLGICLLFGSVYLLLALGPDAPGAAKLRYGAVIAGLLGV